MMELLQWLNQFHFLRPLWLLALLPAIMLFLGLRRWRQQSSNWQQAIDPSLLPFLLEDNSSRQQRNLLPLLLAGWLLATLALAGPTWSKLPQPVQQREDALILLFDLSLSMFATDQNPSRLVFAQRKLTDILQKRREGLTALLVYSGDAHVVSPLTDDSATISAMVPALTPNIMPSYGSNASAAFERAQQLMKDGGIRQARIVFITDEIHEKDASAIARQVKNSGIELSIMGIGTQDGAPIPISKGGFLKDSSNAIVVARLNRDVLQQLAHDAGGRYSDGQLGDRDIDTLLPPDVLNEHNRESKREFDIWQEQGHWLALLILPLALLCFRRGWLLVLFIWIGSQPQPVMAFEWQDQWQNLWQRPDQQGAHAFATEDYKTAAQKFSSSNWRGAAQYRAGDYENAAQSFAASNTAEGFYNQGNALAQAGQIDKAIAAYNKALELDPDHTDATANRDLLEELKKQQQQEQEQKNNEQQSQDQEKSQQQNDQQNDQQNQQADESPSDSQQSASHNGSDNDQSDGTQKSADQQSADKQSADKQAETEQRNKSHSEQQEQQKEQQEQNDSPDDQESAQAVQETDAENSEKQQALEQWLRKVPDDPGGLLRRKFDYQYQQNQQNKRTVDQEQIW